MTVKNRQLKLFCALPDPEKGSVTSQIKVCFLTNGKDLQVPNIERIHP